MTYDPYDLYGLSINTYIYIDGSHPASEVYLTRSRGAIGYLAPTAPMEFMAGAFGWSQGPKGLRNAALRQRIKGK